jgi:2-dehydro-3-deoxygluconokinase
VTHGGAESNTCVGAARLGLRAAWVGRLGTDAAGDRIAAALASEGVDLRWVVRDPGRPTGLMLRDTVGGLRYERSGSAAAAISPDDLERVPVADARAVFVTGITAMLGEGPAAAAATLLDRANGLRAVDPNLRPNLWGRIGRSISCSRSSVGPTSCSAESPSWRRWSVVTGARRSRRPSGAWGPERSW